MNRPYGARAEHVDRNDPAAVAATMRELDDAMHYAATVLVLGRDPDDPAALSVLGLTVDPSVPLDVQALALEQIAATMRAHHDERGAP